MQHLIRIYTVCYSSSSFWTQQLIVKFNEKYGKELMITTAFGRFSSILNKEHNFCDCLLAYHHVKRSTLKGKNLLLGSKFFPFRVDPFSEGSKKEFWQSYALESVSVPHKVSQYLINPFILELLKWTLPFLNLDLTTDENRGFSLKWKTQCKTV